MDVAELGVAATPRAEGEDDSDGQACRASQAFGTPMCTELLDFLSGMFMCMQLGGHKQESSKPGYLCSTII